MLEPSNLSRSAWLPGPAFPYRTFEYPRDGAVSSLGTDPTLKCSSFEDGCSRSHEYIASFYPQPKRCGMAGQTLFSGPGAPYGMSPWPCLSGQVVGFPHSYHQYKKHRIKPPGKRAPHWEVSPGLCPDLLAQSTTLAISRCKASVRVMTGNPKATRAAQQTLLGRASSQPCPPQSQE